MTSDGEVIAGQSAIQPAKGFSPAKFEVNASCRAIYTCSTPLSQASTAPPTPAGGPLPEPLWASNHLVCNYAEVDEDYEEDPELEAPPTCFGMPPLESKLGLLAQAIVEAEAWLKENQQDDSLSQDLDNTEVDDIDLEPVRCVGMPPLQSKLGRWAQAVVEAEVWLEDALSKSFALKALEVQSDLDYRWEVEAIDLEPVRCVGMPALQSKLGRWAQAVVEAEVWLEESLAKSFALRALELQSDLGYRCAREVMLEDCAVAEGLQSELGLRSAFEVLSEEGEL